MAKTHRKKKWTLNIGHFLMLSSAQLSSPCRRCHVGHVSEVAVLAHEAEVALVGVLWQLLRRGLREVVFSQASSNV